MDIERPTIFDLLPRKGSTSEETEVWIKGRFFGERGMSTPIEYYYSEAFICLFVCLIVPLFLSVVVHFGDHLAHLLDVSETLLTVRAPPRPDLTQVHTYIHLYL